MLSLLEGNIFQHLLLSVSAILIILSSELNLCWLLSETSVQIRVLQPRDHDRKDVENKNLDAEIIESEITFFGILLPALFQLYTNFFRRNFIPDPWRESYLIPIFKGKSDSNSSNKYKALALGNMFYTLYSSIMKKRLLEWAMSKNLIPVNQ